MYSDNLFTLVHTTCSHNLFTPVHQDESRAKVRENMMPDRISPIPIQLADLDSPENGCPCTLKFDPNMDPLIMELFAVEKDPEVK